MPVKEKMELAVKILKGQVTVNGFTFQFSQTGSPPKKVDPDPLPNGVVLSGELVLFPEGATVKAKADGRFKIYPVIDGTIGDQEYAEVQGTGDWVAFVTANNSKVNKRYNPPV